MNIDQAIAKAFDISLLVQMKLPDPEKRKAFLEKVLCGPAQQKREFFVTLRRADQSLKDLKVDFLDFAKNTKLKMSRISKEAKSVYKASKTGILKKNRKSIEPNI